MKVMKSCIVLIIGTIIFISALFIRDMLTTSKAKPTSYALYKHYKSIDEMVRESELIVIGTVKNIGDEFKIVRHSKGTLPDGSKRESRTCFGNIYSIKVDRVMKGNVKSGDIIEIGRIHYNMCLGNKVAYEEIKRYNKENAYVFFVRKIDMTKEEGYEENKSYYSPITPFQGQIALKYDKDENCYSFDKNDEINEKFEYYFSFFKKKDFEYIVQEIYRTIDLMNIPMLFYRDSVLV